MAPDEGTGWGDVLTLKVVDGKTGEVKRWIEAHGNGKCYGIKEALDKAVEVIQTTLEER